MIINDKVLQQSEKIIFSLRELYLSKKFSPYRMSKFEEYDLYADNKDFLVSDNVITFNDIGGKLMALKPDVTLSIIKNSVASRLRRKSFSITKTSIVFPKARALSKKLCRRAWSASERSAKPKYVRS